MTYEEALDYMFSRLPMFQRIGPAAYKADLSRTIALCKALDNPQDEYPGIHIAGTNGKGSVASLLAATLQSAGYRTGLFTSPHLVDYRERIRVDGEKISEDFIAKFIGKHRGLFDAVSPSFFEMSYGLAASWFLEQHVDLVVWETGMGGRLDSTNIINPILSVITNIGYDHMQFLGETLPEIAREKAGIIKTGVAALVGQYQAETAPVFEEQSARLRAPLCYATDRVSISFHPSHPLDPFLTMDVSRKGGDWLKGLQCALSGAYQRFNIPTALAAIDMLTDAGFPVADDAVRKGFQNVRELSGFAGRWLRINEDPPAFCDTGHNAAGIAEVSGMLSEVSCRVMYIVFGTVEDKDVTPLLALLPRDATYLFCQADIPRAMPVNRLYRKAVDQGLSGSVHPSCGDAYRHALSKAGPQDFIFVGGSTFVVAEVLAACGDA